MIINEMWEQYYTPSAQRRALVRSMFSYVVAVLIAALLWVIFTPNNSLAVDVAWDGESLVYEGNTYTGPASESTVSALDFPEETVVYTYTDPDTVTDRKTHVLYFAPGNDPGTSDGANYRTYDYGGPGIYSNGSTPAPVTLTPAPAESEELSSCDVDGGLGWIICPVTNTLAGFMDVIFDILAGFLEVTPPQTGQDNALYRAWSYMRTFANLAFVIVFLIIIYSQVTSMGVSNYGIKRLLPRIIIAAILMNLSYLISSLAIDLSNVLGYSLQELFTFMRDGLVGEGDLAPNTISWESMASFILSGGALTAGLGIATTTAIASSGGVAAAALAIFLPALLIVLLAVLVAFLVMAARQAIITILVVLSPLAFVAYLLPNTEKWFDKWRGLFMTMLILFPAFSLVFGGSQFAAAVIIQNANSINTVILGMLVQAAPLYITPLLVKLSGSLIGRIAGLVNNPNRGIVDRTRNFAKDRAENMKAKNLAEPAKKWELGKRAAKRFDHNRRRREGWRNAHGGMTDATWANTGDFAKIDSATRDANREKQFGEARSEATYLNQLRQEGSETLERELKLRVKLDEVTLEKGKLDKIQEELRTGNAPEGASAVFARIAERNGEVTRNIAVNSIATQAAKRLQNSKLSEDLLKNTDMIDGQLLQSYAGSIDESGTTAAVAFAASQKHEADVKLVNERAQIMRQFELNGTERQDLAMGRRSIHKVLKNNQGDIISEFTFDKNDEYAQEAAQDMQLGGQGNVANILEIIAASGSTLSGNKKDIAASIPKSGLPGKAAFTSGVFIDKVLRGKIGSMDDIHSEIVNTYIADGKFKAEQLAQNDAYAIQMMHEAVAKVPPQNRTAEQKESFNALAGSINEILKTDRLRSYTTKKSRDEFNQLLVNLGHQPVEAPDTK